MQNSPKTILIIAFHLPPFARSSGYLRILKFMKYLPQHNIKPIVLSANTIAYDRVDESLLSLLPENVAIKRAFGLDAKQHLSLLGRYPEFVALPDRYISWAPAAIWAGVRMVQKYNVDAVLSTYPVPSAHVIARRIASLTKRPWLADFRDPMWDDYSNFSAAALKSRKTIEERSVLEATQVIVTTKGMKELFVKRYGDKVADEKIVIIENGYDESDFALLPHELSPSNGRIRLLHAGLLEPIDRNPLPFFQAIKKAIDRDLVKPESLRIEFYASGNEQQYKKQIAELGLQNVLFLLPPLPYERMLQEMSDADILLLFQGPSCNQQVPAKAYEYLRIGRPIFALTPDISETARLIKRTRAGLIVSPDDSDHIAAELGKWLSAIAKNQPLTTPQPYVVQKFSRQFQTKQLARCILNTIKSAV